MKLFNLLILNYLLQNEGMTGVLLFNIRFSRVTFGLMEDTGLAIYHSVYMSFTETVYVSQWLIPWLMFTVSMQSWIYDFHYLTLSSSSALTVMLLLNINHCMTTIQLQLHNI